ncbi:MAG: hypothetical protein QOD63_1479, partial [Actinomycetota bacterium]|nr:hypothetical protein [Actinomycetota bacterium]
MALLSLLAVLAPGAMSADPGASPSPPDTAPVALVLVPDLTWADASPELDG